MKKLILALILGLTSMSAFSKASSEDKAYCEYKFAEVQTDRFYIEAGCIFDEETQTSIQRNQTNAWMNCKDILTKPVMMKIASKSSNQVDAAIDKYGKGAACEANAKLYPAQISN